MAKVVVLADYRRKKELSPKLPALYSYPLTFGLTVTALVILGWRSMLFLSNSEPRFIASNKLNKVK